MKTLLLIRHAKSSWDIPSYSDFDRPLNERGLRNAPEMALRLKKMGVHVDTFVTSPAKRAKMTAQIFASALSGSADDLLLVPSLYDAESDEFYRVVRYLDNSYNTVAIVSHNPGISDFANQLTKEKVGHFPTCAIFAVDIDCDNWSDVERAKKIFRFFDYPKSTNHL